jgi:hypothetical protein
MGKQTRGADIRRIRRIGKDIDLLRTLFYKPKGSGFDSQ